MARKNPDSPVKRAARLETRRRKLEERVKGKRTYAALGRYEGELNHRQFIAITLRLAGYKHADIADAMGETTQTVEKWFNDPDVKKLYMVTLEGMADASQELLRSFMLEAIHTIVDVMRHGNYKEALEAAREILDRGGLPKVSRSESTQEKKEIHTIDESIIARLQEAAANPESEDAMKPIYEMLEEAANSES